MAKKKSNDSGLIIEFFYMFVEAVVGLIFYTVFILIDLVRINVSGYKQKSGNGFFKTFFNKGNYGEFKLYRKLIKIFGKSNVYTNIYLDNVNTELTEVDLLAISPKGVYVFEMKNYGGYIYGSSNDTEWTQSFSKRSKFKFYNPLKQNYAHTKAVEKYLELKDNEVIPLVVFGRRAKLQKINIKENQTVITFNDVNKFIKKHKKYPNQFTKEQMDEFKIKIVSKCHMSDEAKQRHIEEIRELKA